MDRSEFKCRLPGYIATGLVILTTTLWTFWGVAEMYYEGWGLPFPEPMRYLTLGAVCLALTLVALTWPRFGGWLIILIGGTFTAWWWVLAAGRGWLNLQWILSTFPVSGLLILTGVLFLFEGRYRQRLRAEGWTPHPKWLRRYLRYVLAVGLPLLVAVAVSVYFAPILLTRVDDGDRGARLIEGNNVTLVWAPEGPGWNWMQPWGGYPSWDHIALYGVPPVGFEDKPGYDDRHATQEDMETTGLCRYLSEDGLALRPEPQDVWRMPTTDEIVRSLVRHGENAGCTWDGESEQADCRTSPDKETPLWAPNRPPIYYWSADEYDEREAYYVGYNGQSVSYQPKSWGNPRHGYRCVREECPGTGEVGYSIPEPPSVREPEPVSLPSNLQNRCSGGEVLISSDTDSARFEGCTVFVKESGISITRSEFVNSRIFFEFVSDVVFSDNVVRDHFVHEEAAITVGVSENIVLRHNHVKDNAVGVAVGESQNTRIEDNIFDSNYQHNAIAMYKSSGEVSGNLFRYNFPHGILVHFVPEHAETAVHIHDNIFLMNVEDAINFEDWSDAKDESKIYNNIIARTAWAGINVEYNSWNANILIENNHISESGYPIEMFPKNPNAPEKWDNGWGHGIKIEDCSGITVRDNTILDNNENGIDVRNCRNVTLQGNTVAGNNIGIFIGGPDPGSFTRDVSPLSEENAGPSIASYKDNHVFKNNEIVIERGTE